MKKYALLLLPFLAFFIASCESGKKSDPVPENVVSDFLPPSVQMVGVYNITDSTAMCVCQLLSNGNDTTTEYGIKIYNEEGYDTFKKVTYFKGDTCFLTGLDCGTEYTYGAYARNICGQVEDFHWRFKTTGPTIRNYIEKVYEHDAKISIYAGVSEGMLTEYGYCYADHPMPTLEDKSGKWIGGTNIIGNLELEKDYYLRGYAVVDGKIRYGGQRTFHTNTWVPTCAPGEAVDLGLSVLWADRNLEAPSRAEQGELFPWGECKPKFSSNKENCPHYSVEEQRYVKYTQAGENLQIEDDAARFCWGGKWRMPTKAEVNQLLNYCNVQWGTCDNQGGWIITSNTTGNSIFIPCYRSLGMTDSYLTSTLAESEKIWYYATDYSDGPTVYKTSRLAHLLIRPVCDK